MDFGQAIHELKAGKKVARSGWNGKGMWLWLVRPQAKTQFQHGGKQLSILPYIEMKTADDGLVPWLASQTDVLAEDWVVVE